MQVDPIEFEGGQWGIYSYVGNDPITWGDPSGESSISFGQTAKGDDALRKQVLPNVNYGIGSVLGYIAELLVVAAHSVGPLNQLPPNARDYHPGAGQNAGPAGENDPKCIAAKARVRAAKDRVGALGAACTLAKDRLNYARMRANLEEGLPRTLWDQICPMDPVDLFKKGATRVGELNAKMNAFGHANRCRAIISLWGR